jgi:flagellar biosynthesis/type III secretory pathway protein FliH
MTVPLPERMRRGDFSEVRVCKDLGERLAREIYDDPMLRSAKVAYDKGYKAGYEEGHRVGYEEGYRDGEAAGDRQGYSRGYDDGKKEGQRDSDD